MIVPHLHFGGRCKEALALYERAFGGVVESVEYADDGRFVVHAEMRILGSRVMLNDRFGNPANPMEPAAKLIALFRTADALKACFAILSEGGTVVDPLSYAAAYTPCGGQVIDKFGVMWGLMADERS